ncbi:MAG: dicarboxylate/amino acid:cation symporter [Gemmatimonadetes bacterium]|nr:dicarboxylate/amino acid:cation symporter [Gemmatimonadota bacterium]
MKLHNKILLGLILGTAFGVSAHVFARDAGWLAFVNDNVANPVGQVFLRMLLMTVIPLVFASIALGVAGLGDLRKVGRVGGKTIAYFLLSTVIAATIGMLLVNVVRPGGGMDPSLRVWIRRCGSCCWKPTARRPWACRPPATARSASTRSSTSSPATRCKRRRAWTCWR